MCSCFRVCQYMLAVFLLFSSALYITSGVVNYWWVQSKSMEFSGASVRNWSKDEGLWKTCTTTSTHDGIRLIYTNSLCHRRSQLLKFEDTGLNKDIVLVALMVAACLTLVPLVFVIVTMCQRYPSKMTILIGFIIMFFGMASGVFGTIWALAKISHKNQGWAFYCLYGADAFAVFSFVLCLVILVCLQAPSAYRTTNRDDEIAMLAR